MVIFVIYIDHLSIKFLIMEGIEKGKLPINMLKDKLREVGFVDSWEEALGRVLDAIHTTESLFTFNQLKVINENFPKIEMIMKEIATLGSSLEDDDRRNRLCAEKAELVGSLPKDYDIQEIVARVTEVAGENIDSVYAVQDKKRLKEFRDEIEAKD